MFSLLLAIIYMAYVGLGLPDSLLGSAWPLIYQDIHVPMSWSGVIFMIISVGTVISSLNSDRLSRKFGVGKVAAFSVAITCAALFGFSFCHSFFSLCLWAVPYGLGAGSVDAALNNYVALHYASRHMNWLHCMWGLGASVSPYIMGSALAAGKAWNTGYRRIGLLQVGIAFILFISLPLWEKGETCGGEEKGTPLALKEIIALKGAKAVMLCFFCYCALEQTVSLWASSYLVNAKGVDEAKAAGFASLFFLGITIGRAVSGFISFKLNDTWLVRIGQIVILVGLVLILLPLSPSFSCAGLIVIGFGCAPIYPSIIHSTPEHFGTEHSQAIVGVQMASAYIGTSIMPPVFGWLSEHLTIRLFPFYLLLMLVFMVFMHERLAWEKHEVISDGAG